MSTWKEFNCDFIIFLAPITSLFCSRLSKFCGKSQTKFGPRVYADSSFLVKSKATLNRRNSGAKSPRPLPKMTRYFFFGLRQASAASMVSMVRRRAFSRPSSYLLSFLFLFFISQQSLLHRKERKEMEERQQLAPVYESPIEILVFKFM